MKTCGESRVDLLAHEKRGPDCLYQNGANPNLDMTGSHAILLRLGTPTLQRPLTMAVHIIWDNGKPIFTSPVLLLLTYSSSVRTLSSQF